MSTYFQPLFIISFFVLVRAGDLAITAGVARDILRAVFYGIAALLALVFVVITVFHV